MAGRGLTDTAVIIPARMGSVRLPGKPVADICGKPLIVRVLEGVASCGAGVLAVATDSGMIASTVRKAGFEAVLTGDAPSGSARVYEAWRLLGRPGGTIVNLQGDEPFVEPAWIEALLSVEPAPDRVSTLSRPCDPDSARDPSSVKVAAACDGRALYFSRSPIPHGAQGFQEHAGVYCFSPGSLEACAAAPPCPLADAERLEQLAWLCAGIDIRVVEGDFQGFGVDTPEDLERARELFGCRNRSS